MTDDGSMTGRKCLPCTACCDGWLSSKVIEMSPGQACTHCTSQGCAIYEHRPQEPCRTFECAWVKTGSSLPEHMLPDRCGAIVMLGRRYKGMDVIMATPTGWSIPTETLGWLMAYAKKQSIPLIYMENLHRNGVYTHFKRSGYGPLEFVRAISDPGESLDIRVI